MKEKFIDGYDGKYIIREDGVIINTLSNKRVSTRMWNGYEIVDLHINGKRTTAKVHRLLALAFIPNPDNKPTVDHIDRNPSNNTLSNLRWATYSEQIYNQKHTQTPEKEAGRIKATKKVSKPVEMRDKNNHSILYKTFDSCRQAAELEFGDPSKNSLINRCANGNKASAYGYWWCFVGSPAGRGACLENK